MRQYLDLTTWIILFALAPLTILILLSQNTVPGDVFYPVKRGMENVVLAAASVNPSTRVAFRTDLTEKRFQEAQQLLAIKADTTAFSSFVSDVSTTQQDLSNFSNAQEEIQASDKLIAKIDQYQNQLTQVENQVLIAQGQTPSPIIPSQSEISTPNPIQTPQPTTGQVTMTSQPSQSTEPTQQPQVTPIPTIQPTEQPVVVPSTPIPTIQPQAVNTIIDNPQKTEEVKATIANTKVELGKIKEKLKEQRDDAEVKQKFQEDRQKFQEESKKRQDNGNNN